jgi:hypothetical protein
VCKCVYVWKLNLNKGSIIEVTYCSVLVVFFRINNGLLTLDMGLANRILECNLM